MAFPAVLADTRRSAEPPTSDLQPCTASALSSPRHPIRRFAPREGRSARSGFDTWRWSELDWNFRGRTTRSFKRESSRREHSLSNDRSFAPERSRFGTFAGDRVVVQTRAFHAGTFEVERPGRSSVKVPPTRQRRARATKPPPACREAPDEVALSTRRSGRSRDRRTTPPDWAALMASDGAPSGASRQLPIRGSEGGEGQKRHRPSRRAVSE